jgi:hypothetical protein
MDDKRQEQLHLLTVTLCCWPAVNKAVSPCDLSIIFIQLLLEPPVQVDQTAEGNKRRQQMYNIYCTQYVDSGLEVM